MSVVVTVSFPDLQACVLSSVELQVLTSSCFKLRTVHNIPVTSNKDGKKLLHKHLFFFLSSCVWTLSMFLLRPPLFSTITNIRSHCSFLSSVFSLNSYTKAPFTLSAQKSHIMRDRGGSAGENVGYNVFLIQLVAVSTTQCVGCGLRWALSSCTFVFAPDLRDALLSEPGGDIKAICLTYSDHPKWHLHAHTVQNHNHSADRVFNTLKSTLSFTFWHLKRSKLASNIMGSLCKSAITLTSNTFKVVIVGIVAFYLNLNLWISREIAGILYALNSFRCQLPAQQWLYCCEFILLKILMLFFFCVHAHYPLPAFIIYFKDQTHHFQMSSKQSKLSYQFIYTGIRLCRLSV